MAVPGHDERDFAFANKFNLPIRRVILDASGDVNAPLTEAFTEAGPMCNSGEFDTLEGKVAQERVTAYLEQWGHGKASTCGNTEAWEAHAKS